MTLKLTIPEGKRSMKTKPYSFPYTYGLLCFKKFLLLYNIDGTKKEISQEVEENYIPHESDNDEDSVTPCESLHSCIGYQACIFQYGNEFCHEDPIPGSRKVNKYQRLLIFK